MRRAAPFASLLAALLLARSAGAQFRPLRPSREDTREPLPPQDSWNYPARPGEERLEYGDDGRVRLRVVPFHGGPVPSHGHVELRTRFRGDVAGFFVLLFAYAPMFGVGVGCMMDICPPGHHAGDWLVVPAAGPLITTLLMRPNATDVTLLMVDLALQLTGGGLLIASLASGTDRYVVEQYARRERPRWVLGPGPLAAHGLSLSATFE